MIGINYILLTLLSCGSQVTNKTKKIDKKITIKDESKVNKPISIAKEERDDFLDELNENVKNPDLRHVITYEEWLNEVNNILRYEATLRGKIELTEREYRKFLGWQRSNNADLSEGSMQAYYEWKEENISKNEQFIRDINNSRENLRKVTLITYSEWKDRIIELNKEGYDISNSYDEWTIFQDYRQDKWEQGEDITLSFNANDYMKWKKDRGIE